MCIFFSEALNMTWKVSYTSKCMTLINSDKQNFNLIWNWTYVWSQTSEWRGLKRYMHKAWYGLCNRNYTAYIVYALIIGQIHFSNKEKSLLSSTTHGNKDIKQRITLIFHYTNYSAFCNIINFVKGKRRTKGKLLFQQSLNNKHKCWNDCWASWCINSKNIE